MDWRIPGTTIEAKVEDSALVEEHFRAMFLAGGMVLSQVANLTGLEPYTIQNWVKRGFLTSPQQKRYTLNQLCRILNINMLKSVLPMEQICGLLTYINGNLDDTSDDLIDDSDLYFMFVRLAAEHRRMHDPKGRDALLQQVLADYREPVPGAKQRVKQVLCIMLTAWAAGLLGAQATEMIEALKSEKT